MRIAVGADHAGFELKQGLAELLRGLGHEVNDVGTHSEERCDYPDFGAAIGRAVTSGQSELGVGVCGSGIGIAIAANKGRKCGCACPSRDRFRALTCPRCRQVTRPMSWFARESFKPSGSTTWPCPACSSFMRCAKPSRCGICERGCTRTNTMSWWRGESVIGSDKWRHKTWPVARRQAVPLRLVKPVVVTAMALSRHSGDEKVIQPRRQQRGRFVPVCPVPSYRRILRLARSSSLAVRLGTIRRAGPVPRRAAAPAIPGTSAASRSSTGASPSRSSRPRPRCEI